MKFLIDFAFPRKCIVSGELIDESKDKFKFISNKSLARIPSAPSSDYLINRMIKQKISCNLDEIIGLYSIAEDHDYMRPIYKLKYASFKNIGREFGSLLGKKILNDAVFDYDYLVPVPIHKARFRERGYNQSLMIAEGMHKAILIRIDEMMLIRNRYTKTQTALSADQRRDNLQKAFIANDSVKGKNLLLVDDVFTTGSTLNNCAIELKDRGANLVGAAVIAVA